MIVHSQTNRSLHFQKLSSNPVHGEVYSIQHYVIKFASDLQHAGRWFSTGTSVSFTNKTYRHDKTEILVYFIRKMMYYIHVHAY
jgi:hypothetical protein